MVTTSPPQTPSILLINYTFLNVEWLLHRSVNKLLWPPHVVVWESSNHIWDNRSPPPLTPCRRAFKPHNELGHILIRIKCDTFPFMGHIHPVYDSSSSSVIMLTTLYICIQKCYGGVVLTTLHVQLQGDSFRLFDYSIDESVLNCCLVDNWGK